MNDVTLHIGVSHARAAIPAVLDLVARGLVDPGAIEPVVADWDDAPRVLREKATKVIVRRAPTGVASAHTLI